MGMGVLDETRWHYRRYQCKYECQFYEFYLTPDLFAGFQVVRVSGNLDNDRCRQCAEWFDDYADALAYIERMHTHWVDVRCYKLVSQLDPEKPLGKR